MDPNRILDSCKSDIDQSFFPFVLVKAFRPEYSLTSSAKATTQCNIGESTTPLVAASKSGDFDSETVANKNSQSTTALNHCVDCNCLKQSRRLTKYELEGGGSQILFVA